MDYAQLSESEKKTLEDRVLSEFYLVYVIRGDHQIRRLIKAPDVQTALLKFCAAEPYFVNDLMLDQEWNVLEPEEFRKMTSDFRALSIPYPWDSEDCEQTREMKRRFEVFVAEDPKTAYQMLRYAMRNSKEVESFEISQLSRLDRADA